MPPSHQNPPQYHKTYINSDSVTRLTHFLPPLCVRTLHIQVINEAALGCAAGSKVNLTILKAHEGKTEVAGTFPAAASQDQLSQARFFIRI